MDLYSIVVKLMGPIEPVGSTEIDNQRFQNLLEALDLVNRLVTDIDNVATLKTDQRYSLQRAGKEASDFLSKTLGYRGVD